MSTTPDELQAKDATRIMLRPLASPLPLGFLALFVGNMLVSAAQLHWVPASQGHQLAIGILAFTAPLTVIASLYGFLCRDVVASTGMGVLAGAWATLGVNMLSSPPGTTSPGLGMLLVVAAGALLLPTVGAPASKVVVSLTLALAAVRFAITGGYELTSRPTWLFAAGVCGVVVAGLAFYTALATEADNITGPTVVPLLRTAAGHRAVSGRLEEQVATVGKEPGIREQL